MSVARRAGSPHPPRPARCGGFDPTAGPLVRRFGFGPIRGDAATPQAISVAEGAIRKSAQCQTLDLCGIAKAHAIDRIAVTLAEPRLQDALATGLTGLGATAGPALAMRNGIPPCSWCKRIRDFPK